MLHTWWVVYQDCFAHVGSGARFSLCVRHGHKTDVRDQFNPQSLKLITVDRAEAINLLQELNTLDVVCNQ